MGWEPEALQIPVDEGVPVPGRWDRENQPQVEEDSELPGAHVIVIDVS
jgi:hypothetical protein